MSYEFGDVIAPFTAIIPVKQFCRSKTRLSDDALLRASLAKAFTRDVISAAGQSCMIESVVIVTREPGDPFFEADADVHVVAERSRSTGDALNDAVWRGAAWSWRSRPGHPVVVIPADLAAITARALDETLAIASTVATAYVVDAEGTGTTLLTALDARDLRSHYGTSSALRHQWAGYSILSLADARVRRDVDTPADLRGAMTLGVGPATHEVIRSFGLEADLERLSG